MPPRLFYELRISRGDREIRHGAAPREALDWENVEETRHLLARHLLGAVERDGEVRAHAHLYHLDVHQVKPDGTAERRPHSQFALPYDGPATELTPWL